MLLRMGGLQAHSRCMQCHDGLTVYSDVQTVSTENPIGCVAVYRLRAVVPPFSACAMKMRMPSNKRSRYISECESIVLTWVLALQLASDSHEAMSNDQKRDLPCPFRLIFNYRQPGTTSGRSRRAFAHLQSRAQIEIGSGTSFMWRKSPHMASVKQIPRTCSFVSTGSQPLWVP